MRALLQMCGAPLVSEGARRHGAEEAHIRRPVRTEASQGRDRSAWQSVRDAPSCPLSPCRAYPPNDDTESMSSKFAEGLVPMMSF